jgi:hypothetical protein
MADNPITRDQQLAAWKSSADEFFATIARLGRSAEDVSAYFTQARVPEVIIEGLNWVWDDLFGADPPLTAHAGGGAPDPAGEGLGGDEAGAVAELDLLGGHADRQHRLA